MVRSSRLAAPPNGVSRSGTDLKGTGTIIQVAPPLLLVQVHVPKRGAQGDSRGTIAVGRLDMMNLWL